MSTISKIEALYKAVNAYNQVVIGSNKKYYLESLNELEELLLPIIIEKEIKFWFPEENVEDLEYMFLIGIQTWCNSIRHSINTFEKEIGSDIDSELELFGFSIFKTIFDNAISSYELISELGFEVFSKIISDLDAKRNDENKISLRDIARVWDDRIKDFQKNIALHRKMFKTFTAKRPNVSQEQLLDEIAYWPQGGPKGLPTEDAILKSMLELWLKNLSDSSFDSNSHEGLKAGFIYLKLQYILPADYNMDDSNIKYLAIPQILESDIDDLYNPNALNLLKKLWKNSSILSLPLNIEIIAYFEKPREKDPYLHFGIINGKISILGNTYTSSKEEKKAIEKIINNKTFWEYYRINILTTDD